MTQRATLHDDVKSGTAWWSIQRPDKDSTAPPANYR
jgi:hypothetical protein